LQSVPIRVATLVTLAVLIAGCSTTQVTEAGNVAPVESSVERIDFSLNNPLEVTTTVASTVAVAETSVVESNENSATVEEALVLSELSTSAPATLSATLPPTVPSTAVTVAPTFATPSTRKLLSPTTQRRVRLRSTTRVTATQAPSTELAVPASGGPSTLGGVTSVPSTQVKTSKPATTKKSKKGAKKKKATTRVAATVPPLGGSPGFDGRTITLMNLGTKSHPSFGPLGRSIQGSLESHFAAVNARGGIAGKYPVQVRFFETGYDPAAAIAAYESNKDQVVGVASILGTPIVGALVPALDRDAMTASPASGDSEWATRPSLIPIGSTYQVQAMNGAEYFWSVNGKTSMMCALSVTGSFGESGVEGITYAATTSGGTIGTPVRVEPQTTNLGPAIGALAVQGCKGVMLTTAPGQALTAVLTAAQAGYRPRWIWMSPTWTEQLLTPRTSKILEETSWVMGEGPTLRRDPGADTPGLQTLVAEAKAAGNEWLIEQPNIGALFGFCQALLWEKILERAVANNDLSRNGIRVATQQVGVVSFGGILAPMDYSSPKRFSDGSSTVFKVDGSWLLGLFAVNTGTSASAASYKASR
jgi:ABC-type branched-subunit amino acid transport system substrate-binding protein